MKTFLRGCDQVITRVNDFISTIAGFLVIILNFVVLYAVIMRYIFTRPPLWTDEAASYMLLFIAFMPLGWVFQKGMHIKVDFILQHFNPKIQKWMNVISDFLGTLFSALLVWQTIRLVNNAYRLGWVTYSTQSPTYLPLILLPLGSGLLGLTCLLYGVSGIFRQPNK
ncbi:MAG: TRAP transporter small permease subunit [Deltaproteobacteria bacterium]|nr:TRAP transporter small permease subunit [Deltaproteobacteria bacterium]